MLRIFLTGVLFSVTIFIYAQSPTFNWTKNIGGYHGYATGTDIEVDASGNVYTIGYFEGRVDFDPGIGNYFLTSAGSNDIFVSKSDVSGNLLWAKRFGGSLNDNSKSIAISGTGNICIAGSFSGIADFDPGAAVYNMISSGGTDIFIAMLDASGNLTWARQFGDTGNDIASAVAMDGSDNVYTTGSFIGNIDFDPGIGILYLNSGGNSENTFFSKLNSAGNFVFAKQFSGGISFGNSIAIDASGDIFTAGYFEFTVDFDPGAGVYNLTSQGGTIDIFVTKLSGSGNFIWAKKIGGSDSDFVTDLKVDSAGNLYTIGTFMGTVDFDPGQAVYNLTAAGSIDVFISKLDASGNYLWAARIGGSTNSEKGNSISLDDAGNVYAIGNFNGTVDFDPGLATFNLTPAQYGIFVLKLSTSGTFIWAKVIEGSDNIYGNAIVADAVGNVYTTGAFQEICDFDPGVGLNNLVAQGGKFLFISKLDATGNFLWAYGAGAGASAFSKAMTTDALSNVYITGYFYGKVDFDPGPGVANLNTAVSDLQGDIFVAKYSSSGKLIWAKKMGGTSLDYGNAIVVDPSGNVYTAGSFNGTADFNPGSGLNNLNASSANNDIFVSKLNASGNFVWAKNIGTVFIDDVYSIALDAAGNLFTAGSILSSSYQIYLNKLDPSGNLLWSNSYGGLAIDQAKAIAADVSGNIYITGFFEGNVDMDPGPGLYNLTATDRDIFVSKLDGSGNFVWAKQMGGNGYDQGSSIALDAAGNLHIVGTFIQDADFDPGPSIFNLTATGLPDIFVSKLDSSGNFIWAKQFGGNSTSIVHSIAVDNLSNVYTTGIFYGITDFDPGPGTFNLISNGFSDIFISKLDATGNIVWAQQIGNTGAEMVSSIAIDGSANIYTNGDFYETVDFDPTPGINSLTASGSPDLFIHKMSQCIPPQALVIPSGPTTFCLGESVTLNANSGTGLIYQWIRNNLPISGANSSSYIATTSGRYSVFVSNPIPCSETSNIINVNVPCIPIGPIHERISQYSELDSEVIKVFPNPTSGIFVIDSPKGLLKIFNGIGQQISAFNLLKEVNTFNLSDFPSGIYILQLSSEQSILTKKIILNH